MEGKGSMKQLCWPYANRRKCGQDMLLVVESREKQAARLFWGVVCRGSVAM